jgi:hypothetical protein
MIKMKLEMKKMLSLLTLLFLCQITFGQAIDTTFNAANFSKAIKEVNSFNDLKTQIMWISGIATVLITILGFLGGKTLLDSAITNMLANKLDVKKEHLEDMLKELTKEYDAKTNRKILVISHHSDPTIATIRGLLTGGGFKSANLEFKGINDTINLADKDIVLFVDNKTDSTLTTTQMETFINQYKGQIKQFFYFGVERNLPLDDWKNRYAVTISASNFPDRLASGLLNLFKTV